MSGGRRGSQAALPKRGTTPWDSALTHVSTDHRHPIFEASFALALVSRNFWVRCVSALVADVPAIDMGDHRAEFKT
jgi:hypothetical protein